MSVVYPEFLSKIVTDSVVGIAVVGKDGSVRYMNRAMEELYGCTAKETPTLKEWVECAFPYRAVSEDILDQWTKAAKGDTPFAHNYCVSAEDEEPRWRSFDVYPLDGQNVVVNSRDTTKYVTAQKGYRRIKFAVDHASDAAFVVREDGRFIYVNERATASLGYTRDELLQMSVFDIDPEHTKESWPHRWRELKKMGTAVVSTSHRRKDGTFVPVEMTINIKEFDGKFYNFAFARDVSDRIRAEEALRTSEERYRTFVHNFPGIAFRAEAKPGLPPVFAHGVVEEITGYTEDDFLSGKANWTGITHPDDAPKHAGAVSELLTVPGTTAEQEYRIIRKDGEIRWVHLITVNVSDPDGKPIYLEGTIFDVTDRKAAESELHRLAAAIHEAAESIVVTDTKGTILYVNPCYCELTGYSAEEAIGRTPSIVKSGQHDDAFYAELWRTISSGKTWRGRFINQKKDGTLFHEDAVISSVRDDGKIVNYVAVKRDVTGELALRQQVLQSQKMAAIGQLAHKVAHDFTNVLVMILGHAQMARDEARESPEACKHLDEVVQAANRVSRLTAELLSFARPAPIKPVPTRIDKVLPGVEELLRRTVGPSIDLEVKTGAPGVKVNMDWTQIEQAIVHIAINAMEAMPDGGKLTLSTEVADRAIARQIFWQTAVRSADQKPGDFVILSIEDTGFGMSVAVCSRVFEPFFTTKDSKENTGLGLATVYTIMNQHGGHITAESEPEEGTTIKLYLPVAD